ncbi:MAG: hypothetical protein NTX86_05420 [Candidatus Dependentiae bacterium]|nr:hypothetical protein [Candidatus Dependentiae bacterium]
MSLKKISIFLVVVLYVVQIEPVDASQVESMPDYAVLFTKTLGHDVRTGLLVPRGRNSYQKFLEALKKRDKKALKAIEYAPGVEDGFMNPQGAFAQDVDTKKFGLWQSPLIASPQAAAELIEVYLMALCRDVSFDDYGSGVKTDDDGKGNSVTKKAAGILQNIGNAYRGPRDDGKVTPSVLFRDVFPGNLVGPYVSQFLLLDTYESPQDKIGKKQHIPTASTREFGVSWDDFVAIQNGLIPQQYAAHDVDNTTLRYPINGRDLGIIVRTHDVGGFFQKAVTCLLHHKAPLAQSMKRQKKVFDTMKSLIDEVAMQAQKTVWIYKWKELRLRPEAMAGLVHQAKITDTNPYHLDGLLFDGLLLEWVKEHNALQATLPQNSLSLEQAQTYLLGQVYPGGAPAHPSYPSGHAIVSGACTTVVKALFNDQKKINTVIKPVKADSQDPVALVLLNKDEGADDMTIGSELDKLVVNISFGRNWTGIHYRADGHDGNLLGEEVAIGYLQNLCSRKKSGFTRFEFTKLDGTRIRITAQGVTVI